MIAKKKTGLAVSRKTTETPLAHLFSPTHGKIRRGKPKKGWGVWSRENKVWLVEKGL